MNSDNGEKSLTYSQNSLKSLLYEQLLDNYKDRHYYFMVSWLNKAQILRTTATEKLDSRNCEIHLL